MSRNRHQSPPVAAAASLVGRHLRISDSEFPIEDIRPEWARRRRPLGMLAALLGEIDCSAPNNRSPKNQNNNDTDLQKIFRRLRTTIFMGTGVVALQAVYPYLPSALRLTSLPLVLVASYCLSRSVDQSDK